MLYDQDMPKFLWAEACNTVVYIQIKIPHNALGKITPESVFTGSKPEVSHFKDLWQCGILSCARREEEETG